MAVFMLRVADVEFDDLLVHWVGALDREPSEAATKHPELCNMFRREITDALDVIAHNNVNWPTLSEKVLTTAQVLANDMPQPDVDAIARLKERYAGDFEVEMSGDNVAFIHAPSLYVEARNWGNRRFPVTVVFDPTRVTDSGGLQQKWTIVRKPGVFDRLGFEKSINVAEAQARGLDTKEVHERNFAWGGNRNIVSSPQGAGYGTKLSKETILAIVREHAESGIVS
jgi:hypothetical protein